MYFKVKKYFSAPGSALQSLLRKLNSHWMEHWFWRGSFQYFECRPTRRRAQGIYRCPQGHWERAHPLQNQRPRKSFTQNRTWSSRLETFTQIEQVARQQTSWVCPPLAQGSHPLGPFTSAGLRGEEGAGRAAPRARGWRGYLLSCSPCWASCCRGGPGCSSAQSCCSRAGCRESWKP